MSEEQEYIKHLQKEIKRKGRRWKAGKTKFTKIPPEMFRRSLGLVSPDEKSRSAMRARIARAKKKYIYPSYFDWRDHDRKNWTTRIRDQGGCGSCVAFGVVATMESQWNILKGSAGINLDLSEAHLFFCGGSCGCMFGWQIPPALTYASDHGVSIEKCFPYQDHDMECQLCRDWVKNAYRILRWREVTGVAERKYAIYKNGPLVAALDVYEDFKTYTGGVYQHTTGGKLGSHCVCIVGYDDNQGCWICKNSWGTDWGETGGLSSQRGWFRIAYGECGIDTDWPSYAIADMKEGGVKDGEDQGTTPCCLSAVVRGTPYEQDLAVLRDFRDTQLLKSETARKYIDLYYKYTEAIVEVLRTDKQSKDLAFSLLDTVLDAIRASGTSRDYRFTEKNVTDAMELVRRIAKYAPSELQEELTGYRGELDEIFAKGRGKKLTQFTRQLQKHAAKRRK